MDALFYCRVNFHDVAMLHQSITVIRMYVRSVFFCSLFSAQMVTIVDPHIKREGGYHIHEASFIDSQKFDSDRGWFMRITQI